MIIEPAIRPPSEAESFLLQVTTGCTANTCTFCGCYPDKPFRVKPVEEIKTDLAWGGTQYPDTRKVFLMDGDALALSNARLKPILEQIQKTFPKLARIASYANGFNITARSDAELDELAAHQLKLIYMGLESGSQEILSRCNKRATVEEMIEAVRRVQAGGIKASVIVLLGLGGKDLSDVHVHETITALNRMQPHFLSFLSLIPVPGTELYRQVQNKKFRELDQHELLQEARDILAGLEMERTIFRSNHASNYLALEGRLPNDKSRLIAELDQALTGKIRLRPEFLRGL